MKRDDLFVGKETETGGFNFGEQTAEVFDDMLDRSIPLYSELQRMIGEIAAEFAQDGTHIYDLGCSTGLTMQTLMGAVKREVQFIGLDNSDAMLARARERLERGPTRRWQLHNVDLNQAFTFENASVLVVNLVLQFVRPLNRDNLIRRLHASLRDGGCLILVEKVLSENSTINRLFIKYYYEMKKRNGYSELEIAQKRSAIENVMKPDSLEQHRERLLAAGFSKVVPWFQCLNFASLIALP